MRKLFLMEHDGSIELENFLFGVSEDGVGVGLLKVLDNFGTFFGEMRNDLREVAPEIMGHLQLSCETPLQCRERYNIFFLIVDCLNEPELVLNAP